MLRLEAVVRDIRYACRSLARRPGFAAVAVITLAIGKRGIQTDLTYHSRHVILKYELPLAEIVMDFFDRLKSVSRG